MAGSATLGDPNRYLTSMVAAIVGANDELIDEVTINEVSFTESLLTPGLQTTVYLQDTIHTDYFRNLDDYRGKFLEIHVERPILQDYPEFERFDFNVRQKIYRLSNRENDNYKIESFRLDACDPSLLIDAKTWVTASWQCVSPSKVVSDILTKCLQVPPEFQDVESSLEPRTYFAENLHPLQVITQQSEVALTEAGYDPSFIHFMTYQKNNHEDGPTHHFRSLNQLANQEQVMTFYYNGKGVSPLNYNNPYDIMSYSFPCDFDLLSDILNGYDEDGTFIKGLIVENPTNQTAAIVGTQSDCGLTPYVATTTKGTETEQNTCPSSLEQYLLYRKARMGLLEQDKIALRLTVPFNPNLNAGRVIEVNFQNHAKTESFEKYGVKDYLYGSGLYLITNLTHNIKRGGLGVTIMDCVAQTVAEGVV